MWVPCLARMDPVAGYLDFPQKLSKHEHIWRRPYDGDKLIEQCGCFADIISGLRSVQKQQRYLLMQRYPNDLVLFLANISDLGIFQI